MPLENNDLAENRKNKVDTGYILYTLVFVRIHKEGEIWILKMED